MDIAELPGLIAKHIGMVQAAAGKALENPAMKQMNERHNVWTGNEYNNTPHPVSQDVKLMAEGAYTGNDDKFLTGRAEIMARLGMNDRPMNEQIMRVANTTAYADNRSREMLPKETQAQQSAPQQNTSTAQENLGGDLDTLRHTLLSAKMAQDHPWIGKLALASHEAFGIKALQLNPRESLRDTRINAQGQILGKHVPAQDLEKVALPIVQAMSSKTALDYMPMKVMAQRQAVWVK